MAAKINMRLDKNEMPSQDPNVRNKNFLEVALGYTEEQALDEAARCLNCKNHPCVDGCPVNVRIPEFIAKIVERDYEGAYQVIHQTSSLPAVCGRVCPQESQCEMHCVRGKKGDPVGIGRLERFVADWHNAHSTEAADKPECNGHKVAVVGSGPAGLTCAGDLAKKGYEVTVYEALHLAGGVLVYGIPEFRLPKSIVQKEVDGLKAMGVKVETNTVVGRTITIDELMEENGFEAVFVGSGAGLPMFVRGAIEMLAREGLVEKNRGKKGTVVCKYKHAYDMKKLTSFTDDVSLYGERASSELLSFKEIAPAGRIAELLELEAGERVFYIERKRYRQETAVGLHRSYIKKLKGLELREEQFGPDDSLYEILKSKGIIPTTASEVLEVKTPSEQILSVLGLKPHTAVFYKERVTYSEDRIPFEYVQMFYNPDYYQYKVELRLD